MYRMDTKRSVRKKNLRRYIVLAVFFIVLLFVTTVVMGVGTQIDGAFSYNLCMLPPVLENTENFVSIPNTSSSATQTMTMIKADGKEVGAVLTEQDAQYVLDNLKMYYSKIHPLDEQIHIVQTIQMVAVPRSNAVVSPEELYLTLKKTVDDTEHSMVQSEVDGSEAKMAGEALIIISSVRTETITEKIAPDIRTIEDPDMTIGARNVDSDGKKGSKKVTYLCTILNGTEVSREVLEETVISKQGTSVVRVGTKERIALPGNDGFIPAFAIPVEGRMSSFFGMRRGRMHCGLDIVAPVGTPVNASLGGTVTYAGERGNYGLLVEIDHGNGFVTRYAHNDEILVIPGQFVETGALIARVGETGNAACPHVHYEIRLNDRAVDPLPYLPEPDDSDE